MNFVFTVYVDGGTEEHNYVVFFKVARNNKIMQFVFKVTTEQGRYNPKISNGGNAITVRNFPRQVRRLQLAVPTPNSGAIG
jgi:hypothetical protein